MRATVNRPGRRGTEYEWRNGMSTDAPYDASRQDPAAADLGSRTDYLDPGLQREMRANVIRLAFKGDEKAFEEFLRVLGDATPAGVEVILRGSSITGHKGGDESEPFDHDGPGTSDLDVTFVGGDMVQLFRKFHIEGIHSVPLSEAHPDASPALVPLRERLCAMVHRPVNLQATTDVVQFVRDIVMDQPYLVLLKKPEGGEAPRA